MLDLEDYPIGGDRVFTFVFTLEGKYLLSSPTDVFLSRDYSYYDFTGDGYLEKSVSYFKLIENNLDKSYQTAKIFRLRSDTVQLLLEVHHELDNSIDHLPEYHAMNRPTNRNPLPFALLTNSEEESVRFTWSEEEGMVKVQGRPSAAWQVVYPFKYPQERITYNNKLREIIQNNNITGLPDALDVYDPQIGIHRKTIRNLDNEIYFSYHVVYELAPTGMTKDQAYTFVLNEDQKCIMWSPTWDRYAYGEGDFKDFTGDGSEEKYVIYREEDGRHSIH